MRPSQIRQEISDLQFVTHYQDPWHRCLPGPEQGSQLFRSRNPCEIPSYRLSMRLFPLSLDNKVDHWHERLDSRLEFEARKGVLLDVLFESPIWFEVMKSKVVQLALDNLALPLTRTCATLRCTVLAPMPFQGTVRIITARFVECPLELQKEPRPQLSLQWPIR